MSTPAEQFFALSENQRRIVHFVLVEQALGKWHEYSASRWRIGYVESVCGTSQVVDKKLPAEAFEAASRGCDTSNVGSRYLEPITAMQDWDLEFLDSVKCAYYSVYNLFLKYAAKEPIDDWLIVNQAISSEVDPSKWDELLVNAIKISTNDDD